jgi:hypothetical protein
MCCEDMHIDLNTMKIWSYRRLIFAKTTKFKSSIFSLDRMERAIKPSRATVPVCGILAYTRLLQKMESPRNTGLMETKLVALLLFFMYLK